jgi:hypothetical protein
MPYSLPIIASIFLLLAICSIVNAAPRQQPANYQLSNQQHLSPAVRPLPADSDLLLFLVEMGAHPRVGQPVEVEEAGERPEHQGFTSPLKRALSNQGGFKFYGARGKRRNMGGERFSYVPLRG